MFLLLLAHLGSPRQRAVKQLCVCVCVRACGEENWIKLLMLADAV